MPAVLRQLNHPVTLCCHPDRPALSAVEVPPTTQRLWHVAEGIEGVRGHATERIPTRSVTLARSGGKAQHRGRRRVYKPDGNA